MTRLSLLITAIVACSSAASATTLLSIEPFVQIITVGSTVTVDVDLTSTATNIYGFDVAVQYPSFLTYTGVTEQGFFGANGSGLGLADGVDNPGYVTFLFDSASTPDNLADPGPDTLFTLSFVANDTGTGPLSIGCDGPNDCADFPMLGDASFDSIPVDMLNLGFVASTPAPPPPTVPEPSTLLPLFGIAIATLGRQLRLRRQDLKRLCRKTPSPSY